MTERNPYHPDGLWPTAGSYTRTDESPDLMDGGVTAARIEEESDGWTDGGTVGNAAYWRARAERAEALCSTETAVASHRGATVERLAKERDEARRYECGDLDAHWRLEEVLASLKEANATVASLRAERPRPLTADDITDGMVRRALDTNGQKRSEVNSLSGRTMRIILTAALTEPQRPAWADLADTLHAIDPGEVLDIDDLAEAAHERGVRVASVGLTPINPDKEQNR